MFNRQLKDGDRVVLKQSHKADFGYMFDEHTGIGTYDMLQVLPGARGIVVTARTPKVFATKGDEYFANVDFTINPQCVVRVRCDHSYLTKEK